MAIQFPFGFDRLNRIPLDSSSVFANLESFENYLLTGACYSGQIVAVRNETNNPTIYVVNEDFTAQPIDTIDGGVIQSLTNEMVEEHLNNIFGGV